MIPMDKISTWFKKGNSIPKNGLVHDLIKVPRNDYGFDTLITSVCVLASHLSLDAPKENHEKYHYIGQTGKDKILLAFFTSLEAKKDKGSNS